MKIVFVIPGGPPYAWADCSLADGIGGSEETAILLSREFAKLGHDVTVFNNCKEWSAHYLIPQAQLPAGSVAYYDITFYADSPLPDEADLLISWRSWYPLQNRNAKKKFHSTHDIPVGCHAPCQEEILRADSAFLHLDKIVFLNNYHRSLHPWIPDNYSAVIPIGLQWELWDQVVGRDRARVLYFSHPGRGLDRLREVWPQVKAAVPEATLASFWWEPEHFREPNAQLGILPMQRLNNQQAATETLRAGVFGYPCVFAPEISPATTIKAQMGGCYPCVVSQGGMVDTVKFGCVTDQDNFASELIATLQLSIRGELENERCRMKQWAMGQYYWPRVAQMWLEEAAK